MTLILDTDKTGNGYYLPQHSVIAQNEEFGEDLSSLKNKVPIGKRSRLLSLHPFLDKDNLLHVGGRIQNSEYNYDKKHPILLPKEHILSELIFRDEHIRMLHCGPQLLLACIREILTDSRAVYSAEMYTALLQARYTVQKCIICFRAKPTNEQYLMSNLPYPRINRLDPFDHTGIDYAGPILIMDSQITAVVH